MKEKMLLLVYFLSLGMAPSMAQCPPKVSFWKDTIQRYLLDETANEKKLGVLLDYRNKIIRCGFHKDSTYAWVLERIAFAFGDQKKFYDARDYTLQALEINKSYINDRPAMMAVIEDYYWLSAWYDSLNNAIEKRKAMDSCIAVSKRINYLANSSFIWCIENRMQYFYDIGEYKLCINDAEICQKSAREYIVKYSDPANVDWGGKVIRHSFHWQINALLKLKNTRKAQELLADKLNEYKQNGPVSFVALTYAQFAEIDTQRHDYINALANFTTAFKTYKKDRKYFNCKQTLKNIGEGIYFRHFKMYDKALAYFKSALTFKNIDPLFMRDDPAESLDIYGKIANIYVEQKMFESAFHYFQLALDQLKPGATVTDILYSTPEEFMRYKKIDYVADLLINYGNAYKNKYESTKNREDLEKAISLYGLVDKFLARINITQFEQDSKLLWRQEARRLYENAIEACYLAKDADRAFYFFERSRATLLNIQLTEQSLLGNTDILKLDELKKIITLLTNTINTATNQKEKTILQDSLRAKNDELYTLLQLIKTHYPLYYQNMDTAVLTVGEVRNTLLRDHQAILEMFSGDNAVYSLLITQEQIHLNKLDKPDFEKTVNEYVSYLSNYSLLNKDFDGFRATANHLYKLILQNNPVPQGRIIISPEGYYFPFESLIINNTSPAPDYFIFDHAVSYTYSVRYLFNNFDSSSITQAGNFLGVAPVNYSGFHLSQLSGSDLSLNTIRSTLYKGNLLVGQHASRENFLQQYKSYLINQLYTHSSDSSERNEPVIYFNDSALYLSELIPEGKPVTELIVLSACETGNGKLYQGEGVFSFNRAFASVGIPSSVTNLWSIDNKATYTITETFYRYLAKGLSLDVALQKAKLDYMNGDLSENKMPYYWAAPVLVGKSDKIILSKPFPWKYPVAGISLIAVLFFVLKMIRKHKAAPVSIPGIKGIVS